MVRSMEQAVRSLAWVLVGMLSASVMIQVVQGLNGDESKLAAAGYDLNLTLMLYIGIRGPRVTWALDIFTIAIVVWKVSLLVGI